MGYSYNANFDYTLNSSNDEINMSVDNSLQSFTNCFPSNDAYGACSTCEFYDYEEDTQEDYNCLTLLEEYEIDVFFDDCAGYCVPNGTAQNPISSYDCVSPNEPQVGGLKLDKSSVTIEIIMGKENDFYCERWNLTRTDQN